MNLIQVQKFQILIKQPFRLKKRHIAENRIQNFIFEKTFNKFNVCF